MANKAIRWSGFILLTGAAFLAGALIRVVLHIDKSQPLTSLTGLLFLLACLFLVLALPGMYIRQANAAGWLGLAGYILLQTGTIILAIIGSASVVFPSAMALPSESAVLLLLGLALAAGMFITGLATIRAAVFPKGAGFLLMAASLGFIFDAAIGFIAGFLLLACSLAWIGISMGISQIKQPIGLMPVTKA